MIKAIFIILLNFIIKPVQADFYLEPFIGTLMNASVTDNENKETDAQNGTMYGARTGASNANMAFGLSGRVLSSTFDITDSTTADMDGTSYGVFLSYEFPFSLRVLGEYIFSAGAKDNDTELFNFVEGTGQAIGIGYRPVPFVSINLEYVQINYTKNKTALGENEVDYSTSFYLLSMSYPFSL